jgi:uncharacterized membrane protein YhaH (DUF805 family)
MKRLIANWFLFNGSLSPKDFWIGGIIPGILLGVWAVRLDAEFDSCGGLVYSFLAFSLWPAAALIIKHLRWGTAAGPITRAAGIGGVQSRPDPG